mmetsp:Transcript_8041/g.21425  ORF Transcript_8041/g.21425 Transcript_8041/m.21425 type:complete len:217 (-) Transcript_8041:16-666(-)
MCARVVAHKLVDLLPSCALKGGACLRLGEVVGTVLVLAGTQPLLASLLDLLQVLRAFLLHAHPRFHLLFVLLSQFLLVLLPPQHPGVLGFRLGRGRCRLWDGFPVQECSVSRLLCRCLFYQAIAICGRCKPKLFSQRSRPILLMWHLLLCCLGLCLSKAPKVPVRLTTALGALERLIIRGGYLLLRSLLLLRGSGLDAQEIVHLCLYTELCVLKLT